MVWIYRAVFHICAAVFPLVISYWFKKRFIKKLEGYCVYTKKLNTNSYYHCIFFHSNHRQCREHVFNNTDCGNACSLTYLNTILKFFSSAKQSIDLCMYQLTLRQVMEELIKAQNKGINVRIITDHVSSKMQHSRMKSLKEKYGFDVRAPPYTDSYMHHKYCVVDARDPLLQKMFMGSVNLTLQAIAANSEFIVITNNSEMILHYSNEFELLWNSLEN